MSNHKPRVSVLTAVFNCERYMREAIDSVRAQTFGEWEHIVVDDASTDGTADVLARASQEDERLHVHRVPTNIGQGLAMQEALNRARGEYVAVLDADDVCEPERLQRQVEHLDAHPRTALLGTWVYRTDENGSVFGRFTPHEHHEVLLWGSYHTRPLIGPSLVLRADVLRRACGYNSRPRASVDHEMLLRMSEVAEMGCLPQLLVRYRSSAGQLTQRHAFRQINELSIRLMSLLRTRFQWELPLADLRQYYVGHRSYFVPPEFVERWIALQSEILERHLRWRPLPPEIEREIRRECGKTCLRIAANCGDDIVGADLMRRAAAGYGVER